MAWNKPSADQPTIRKKRGLSPVAKGALVGGVLVAAICAALYFIFSGNDAPEAKVEKKKPARIKEVTPVAAPTNKVEAVKKRVITPEEQRKLCPRDEGWDPAAHPFVFVPTNRREVVEDKHPVARNATEQILHWICSVQPGDPPALCPDLPAMELENINKILDEEPDYQHDESLDRLEAKQSIDMAKKELKEFVAKGGDPHEFFRYYHMQLMNLFQERNLAQQSVMDVIKEDPDLAPSYLEKVNDRLKEKGIKPVTLSPKMRQRLGIDAAAGDAVQQQPAQAE